MISFSIERDDFLNITFKDKQLCERILKKIQHIDEKDTGE